MCIKVSKQFNKFSKNASMTPVELSVYLSHEKVLREFISSGRMYALMFEDDCVINSQEMLLNLTRTISLTPLKFSSILLV